MFVIASAVMLACGWPGSAFAQTAENVAVVINEASAASQRIGEMYVKRRGVPATNVIRVRTSTSDSIDRMSYGTTIEAPISAAIGRHNLHDRILYIVLTKGIPLRISGTAGSEGTISSVDSELTLLYRRMTGRVMPVVGRVENPYYLGSRAVREARQFTHREQEIFLVTRLDGFSVDDALSLIESAQRPNSEGVIVLDQRAGLSDNTADEWLAEAARRLADLGQESRVVLDRSVSAAPDAERVMGYYSWGSNDPQNRRRQFGLQFLPGALAAMFVSTDARTFEEPPADWVPSSEWKTPNALFAGSPQSLTGDLIRAGITGIAGHVAEPYLQNSVRPQILFPAYLAGFNLAEAFYMSMPVLSWQTVVIGDPLCTAFSRTALSRSDIEDSVDPETEFPGLFGKRRLDVLRAIFKGVSEPALKTLLAADARQAHGDVKGLRAALERATAMAPGAMGAQLRLALLYDSAREHEKAVERYRLVIKADPNNVPALNNLAYHLAVRADAPEEALPLAQRAVSLAPRNGNTLDTLAWIQHLSGNSAEAVKHIADAVRYSPNMPEVRLHSAIIHAETQNWTESETNLVEALRLEPSMAAREEVKTLQEKLSRRRR